jgi:hypothetical protein
VTLDQIDEHFGNGAAQLLLTRMEALSVKADEVRRIEWKVFTDLAAACANCDSKKTCEQDLALSRSVGHDWERYCANGGTLTALAELPWFAMA